MEEEEEAEFLRKNIEVQRTIAKIDWGRLHKAVIALEDEGERKEFQRNPRALFEKQRISLPSDAYVRVIDYAKGETTEIAAPLVRLSGAPSAMMAEEKKKEKEKEKKDVQVCVSVCMVVGASVGW
jgi:hypothetical protein